MMNKIVICILCTLMLTCGLAMVFAADLTSHDFSTFKMDVPANATFNEDTAFNGRDSLQSAVANNGGSIAVSDLESNPANVHPEWTDEANDITVQYINCSEDALSSHSNAMQQMYANSSFKENSGNLHIYDMSRVNGDGSYSVCRENDGKSIVIISGKDLDLIKKMGETITFN